MTHRTAISTRNDLAYTVTCANIEKPWVRGKGDESIFPNVSVLLMPESSYVIVLGRRHIHRSFPPSGWFPLRHKLVPRCCS